MSTIIYNLRSGYAKLNDYCHKLNITESANCQCGERETVEHYILHCDKYEEAREKLIHDMFVLSGSMHLSLEVLLTVGADEEVSLIRIITKLPNSEQSYKGKVKTHNYINRQNQSTTGKL